MDLKRIETPGISHYAYLITDGTVAAVVDPCRDADRYLDAARAVGCRISHILETHRQEDFVMGSAYLGKKTGAKIVNLDHQLFGHGDMRLGDGDRFEVGELRFQLLHTPGHTPESVCYTVQDTDTDGVWGIFTGDTLFFGDTGRSDLPDADKSEENAGKIHDSVHGKLAGLDDHALILPAHGPGSVCGSGMADRPWSTLGAEKSYNPVFGLNRDKFAKQKGGERIPRPPYFRHLEKVNLTGGLPPVNGRGEVRLLDVAEFAKAIEDNIVFDCREPEAFAAAHIPNSHSIWMGGLPVFGGWIGDHDSTILLLTDRQQDIDTAALYLSRIGIDHINGGLKGGFGNWRKSGRDLRRAGTIMPAELNGRRDDFQVLDVREPDEYASGHIPGAVRMYVGDLTAKVHELSLARDKPVAVTCGVGHRAGLGVSILLREGFNDVRNLIGGMSAWQALELPLDEGDV